MTATVESPEVAVSNGLLQAPSGTAAISGGSWTIGLKNSKFGYLSAETFGFRVNAIGKVLKKKQEWTLEAAGDGDSVVLRSHLNKYMAVDQFGNVTCDQDEKDENTKFEVAVCDDFSGRWAFKSLSRGYFLGAAGDTIHCVAKTPGDKDLWYAHLAARPQVNLRSIGRKRFAHLSSSKEEIHVDEIVPWGEDTLFTLQFREEENKYAIHTCSDTFLQKDGKLASEINEDCYYSLEFHDGLIALRDVEGRYLAPCGSRAILRTRSFNVTKDELFVLEDSLPQVSIAAAANDRYVSIKQGVDVTANQDEASNNETFQLEYEANVKKWYIRTMQDKYFSVSPGAGIQASEPNKNENCLFDFVWNFDGSLSLCASNGKYVGAKRSGHLYANQNSIADNAKFYIFPVNRRVLVLKSDQGFVGYKGSNSSRLECNKAAFETIIVEKGNGGAVHLRGKNRSFLHFVDDGLSSDSEVAHDFFLELATPTKLRIKSSQGFYVNSAKNGAIVLGSEDANEATLWEY